ncbi:hypothetical protein [Zoogloea sp.]|nr:hypothetical protein [Zoogloea sp.]MCK6396487.1 hypothetical protein [Zoogloea sp.]
MTDTLIQPAYAIAQCFNLLLGVSRIGRYDQGDAKFFVSHDASYRSR